MAKIDILIIITIVGLFLTLIVGCVINWALLGTGFFALCLFFEFAILIEKIENKTK